jgi:2-polyprenyl-3-methyl-5-hydroxy-6-metoxy-1,4-benzoquinol methylase
MDVMQVDLRVVRDEVGRELAAVDAARVAGHANQQGGDVGHHRGERLLVRHLANYAVAAELVKGAPGGPLLDLGSGTGALGAWLARRLGRPLVCSDHDVAVLAIAATAFPDAAAVADLRDVPPGSVPVVTAMEVVEHVAPAGQATLVRDLADRLAPGGVLVMSTPDERGYLGGHSGFAPHIGTVTFRQLEALLPRGEGWDSRVWRLDGPVFRLTPVTRVLEPVVNRVWGVANRWLPAVADALAARAGARLRDRPPRPLPDGDLWVRATQDPDGPGTGLLAVVTRL